MRVAIIGRTEMLYRTVEALLRDGHSIEAVFTSSAAPESLADESDFRRLADRIGCPFFCGDNPNRPDLVRELASMKLDVGVSVNCVHLLGQPCIDTFRLGILNSHAGDLPRYRGNACPNWAILNGEPWIALTVHFMIGNALDAGDIIAQERFPLDQDTYIFDVYAWIRDRTPVLFLRAVEALSADPEYILKRQSQDPADALRCYPRLPSDGEIDWKASAEHIHRLVRASAEPFAGAFTSFNGNPMTVWRAVPFQDDERYVAVPGQVAAIEPSGDVIVITGDGKLRLKEAAFDRGKHVKPGSVIRSIRTRLGF